MAVLALELHVDAYLFALVDPGRAQPEAYPDTSGPGRAPRAQEHQRRRGKADKLGPPGHQGQAEADEGQVEQAPGVGRNAPVELHLDGRGCHPDQWRPGRRASRHGRSWPRAVPRPPWGRCEGSGTVASTPAMMSSELTWRTQSSGRSTTR